MTWTLQRVVHVLNSAARNPSPPLRRRSRIARWSIANIVFTPSCLSSIYYYGQHTKRRIRHNCGYPRCRVQHDFYEQFFQKRHLEFIQLNVLDTISIWVKHWNRVRSWWSYGLMSVLRYSAIEPVAFVTSLPEDRKFKNTRHDA